MNGFNLITLSIPGQIIAAFLGTIGFAVLFGAARRHYVLCGLCGMFGWTLYILLNRYANFTPAEATICGTILVALMSRYFAVWFRCPTTVFLITGVFPMVPGGGIYWTIYYIVSGQFDRALDSGGTAIMVTVAIVFGTILVNEIPISFFKVGRERIVRLVGQK